jgi:DNA-damage-inducible protein D
MNVHGIEFWSARDLMPLLGYGRSWQSFEHAIKKARTACEESGQIVENHFNASVKMVQMCLLTENCRMIR